MQALVFWEPAGLSLDRANPYAALLARALEAHGVRSVAGFREQLDREWLRAHRDQFDVLHLHWPSGLYHSGTTEETTRRCTAMIDALTAWVMRKGMLHNCLTICLVHLWVKNRSH